MAITKYVTKSGITYRVMVRACDGRWMTRTFDDKRDAKAYELKLKQQRSMGNLESRTPASITLDEYFNQWFEAVRHQATPGWRDLQKGMYARYVKPILGEMHLSSITPPAITRVLGRVTELERSDGTKLHVYVLLRKMFGDAVELFELLPKNPVIKKLRPRLIVREARYLSIEEIKKLLTHVSGKPYELALWLGVYMGLRVGEIQALRWEDIDLKRGILHVRRTFSKHEGIFRDYPKGKKQHSHRVPFELLNLLKEARQNARGELAVMPPFGKMLDYWIYRKALKRYCREAEVTVVATHGLRHSTSELYMAHGATRDDLKILFAHSSNSTTDRYIHDRGQRLEKVADVIQLFPESYKNVTKSEPNEKMAQEEVLQPTVIRKD